MELKDFIYDGGFQSYAKFILNKAEADKELEIMRKVQDATLDVMTGKNPRALRDLSYKRIFKLDDGRILLGFWCTNITMIDENTYEAEYSFARVAVAEGK